MVGCVQGHDQCFDTFDAYRLHQFKDRVEADCARLLFVANEDKGGEPNPLLAKDAQDFVNLIARWRSSHRATKARANFGLETCPNYCNGDIGSSLEDVCSPFSRRNV